MWDISEVNLWTTIIFHYRLMPPCLFLYLPSLVILQKLYFSPNPDFHLPWKSLLDDIRSDGFNYVPDLIRMQRGGNRQGRGEGRVFGPSETSRHGFLRLNEIE